MKKLFLLALILSPLYGLAQECDCPEIFNWTQETFENNDAGFAYILEKKGEQAYAIHNQLIQAQVAEITHPLDCQDIIREWLAFFRQGHVEFHFTGEVEADSEEEDTEYGEEQGASADRSGEENPLHQKFLNASEPFLETIDDKTLYLRIPSFRGSEKGKIDSLIASHQAEILSKENLIIDIRNGTGGSDVSYYELLPILYTNPIRTPGVEFLSTELNNQRMYELATNTGIALQFGLNLSEEEMQTYRAQYDTLSNHLGEFVNLNEEKVSITEYDSVYPYPQNIGILINERNASTDEQFLLAAKQSKKVKLFGSTTHGALDISNLNLAYSPEKDFVLVYALSKSFRIPGFIIDDRGIQPDFYIDSAIPESMWIDYVAKRLNE